jgi:hypothetical protein
MLMQLTPSPSPFLLDRQGSQQNQPRFPGRFLRIVIGFTKLEQSELADYAEMYE